MDITAKRDRPRTVTSRLRIKYRESAWRVQEFELWSGSLMCRCAALRAEGWLLVWLDAGVGPARLGEAALGMPGGEAAALLGAETGAGGLARRLALALRRPVYVCCGAAFDRFTMPLVERALLREIRSDPDRS